MLLVPGFLTAVGLEQAHEQPEIDPAIRAPLRGRGRRCMRGWPAIGRRPGRPQARRHGRRTPQAGMRPLPNIVQTFLHPWASAGNLVSAAAMVPQRPPCPEPDDRCALTCAADPGEIALILGMEHLLVVVKDEASATNRGVARLWQAHALRASFIAGICGGPACRVPAVPGGARCLPRPAPLPSSQSQPAFADAGGSRSPGSITTPPKRNSSTTRPPRTSNGESGALLVAAGLGPPTEQALISLLALNGLRVSEATGADIEHLGPAASASAWTARNTRSTSAPRIGPRDAGSVDRAGPMPGRGGLRARRPAGIALVIEFIAGLVKKGLQTLKATAHGGRIAGSEPA